MREGQIADQGAPLSVLRLPLVEERVGLSGAHIYNKINPRSPWFDPDFPKPIRLGSRSMGWLSVEIDAWLRKQAAKRERVVA